MWANIFSTDLSNLVAMIPLLICSLITIAVIFERLFNFRTSRFFNEALAQEVIEKVSNDQKEEAIESVSKKSTLQERVLHDGMIDCFKKGVMPEIAFLDHGLSKLGELAKWVSTLSFIAKVAPLLGLLGTVLGMIDAFDVIAQSANTGAVKPELVAKGIGTALITTASGLMVAIPALITSSILSKIGYKIYTQMEDSLKSITIACGGLKNKTDSNKAE